MAMITITPEQLKEMAVQFKDDMDSLREIIEGMGMRIEELYSYTSFGRRDAYLETVSSMHEEFRTMSMSYEEVMDGFAKHLEWIATEIPESEVALNMEEVAKVFR